MGRRVLAGLVVGGALLLLGAAHAATVSASASGGGAVGEAPRVVRGEVTRVNDARGTVTLRTHDGDVELQLPPATLKGIHKGDRLTVRLGVRTAAGAGARPAAAHRAATGAKAP